MATFGGSIQQLAGIEAQTDAARRANLERVLNAMVDRYHQSQAQDKQFAQQKELQGSAQGERRREFDTQMEANRAHENRLQQYNDTNLGLQKDRLREEQRTRRMQLLDRRRQFTFDDQQKNLRNLLPSAEQMADNGMFENTEDVIKQFPSLSGQAPMLSSRSQAARKMITSELQADQQNAGLLNEGPAQVGRLRNMVAQERENSWNPDLNHWYKSDEEDTGAIDEWNQEATALQGAMDATRRDKSRMQRLSPDATGRFAPSAVLPWTPGAAQPAAKPVAPPAQQFKPGMRVVQNGVQYQFDGQNWVPLR